MDILTTLIYLPVVIAIFVIAIIGFIYRAQRYIAYFASFISATALWLLCQYVAQVSSSEFISLLTIRLSSAISGFLAYSFLVFVVSYVGHRKFDQIRKWYIVPLLVLLPFNFTSLMIQEIEASAVGLSIKSAGVLYFVQIGIVVLYFIRAMYELVRATARAPRYARGKNYLLMFGVGLAAGVLSIGSIVFASSAQAQILVPIAIMAMVLIIGFAIIRHRLFDIRAIVAKVLIYLIAIAALGLIYGGLFVGVVSTLLHVEMSHIAQVFLSILLAAVSIAFASFKSTFDRVTNRIFFQDSYDTDELFDKLNKLLLSTFDLNRLLGEVSTLLSEHLKLQCCEFELDSTDYAPRRIVGSDNDTEDLTELRIAAAKLKRQIVVLHDLEGESAAKRLMDKHDVSVLAYLSSGSGSVSDSLGVMALGPKRSGNPYSPQDIRVLTTIANELVIAIQNALRFEEIQNFNTTLQDRITRATAELRRTNEKLRTLDATKDEFITMASHQLRTPLTSVKGYLSMVLEGDAGKLNAQQRKLLTQSFISSQRMVYLIADLLNLSRLNTGKFVIESVPVDLSEVVQGEIDQLRETAKSRGLHLIYERPAAFPKLMLDETKIHQVVMNFIDNAIYYTPSGGTITIHLDETKTAVEYRVVDNGIGVAKHDQHHLFSKFYRAGNARRARPDGTGLGLFMAKKVIAAQGGAILFASEEGKGSTFGFRISKAKHSASIGDSNITTDATQVGKAVAEK